MEMACKGTRSSRGSFGNLHGEKLMSLRYSTFHQLSQAGALLDIRVLISRREGKSSRHMNSSLERLEARIAPAAVNHVAGTKVSTWTDFDGDLVTFKWTGATDPVFAFHAPAFGVADATMVDAVTLSNTNDAITVTVKPGPLGGDGHVDLGYINATGVALKSFTATKASVLEFDAGDGTHAIGTFSVASYGTLPKTAFTTPGGNGAGAFNGAVTSFKITGDLDYGEVFLGGPSLTNINGKTTGSVTIGGSLHGDVSQTGAAGFLVTDGPVGAVTIGGSIIGGTNGGVNDSRGGLILEAGGASVTIRGDVIGGSLVDTGFVDIEGAIKGALTIGGSVRGGAGLRSGEVSAFLHSVHSVSIGGNVEGSAGNNAGYVHVGQVTSLTIGGNLEGGGGPDSGTVHVEKATSVTIKGSIIGVDVINPVANGSSGYFYADSDVVSLTIGRNVIAGTTTHTDNGTTLYAINGAIGVTGNLGSLSIGGNIEGNNGTRAFITAQGTTPMKAGNFNGLGKLTVKGSVSYAVIASGHALNVPAANLGTAANPDAGIGSVTIGGDFYHSSIMAGTNDLNSVGVGRLATATTSDDTQSVGDPNRAAILGTVTIKGALLDDTDAFGYSGFEAEQIAKIVVGGVTVFKHAAAPGQIKFFDPNHFLFAEEIPTI